MLASARHARHSSITISLLAVLLSFAALAGRAEAQPREPIRYTFRVIDAAKHIAEVDARFPSSGQSSLDLMMPVWTPGFYRVEDYAARVQSLVARTPEGVTLDVTKPRPNRWQVSTNGSAAVVVTYRLLCQGRSVTTTWVDASLGVINGGATFITVADRTPRPHEVLIDLPPTWQASISGLEPAPGDSRTTIAPPTSTRSSILRSSRARSTRGSSSSTARSTSSPMRATIRTGTAARRRRTSRRWCARHAGSGASCRSSATCS